MFAAAMEFRADEGTLRALMRGCESLFRLCEREGLEYWLDWGTLLGCVRHGNIIPWDYDADINMLVEPYRRLRGLLAERGGAIDGLVLWPDYYGNDDEAIMLGFADWPDDSLGIDIVSYEVVDGVVRTRMSPALIADYPGQYDSAAEVVLPLTRLPMLGQQVLVPGRWEARLVECYGPDWRTPRPYNEVDPRAEQLTTAPWRPLPAGWIRRDGRGEARRVWAAAGASAPAGSFTELVFAEDRRRWGSLYVGELAAGESLVVPDGVVAWSPE